MEWLILLVAVPAMVVPVVLLWGFAGCSSFTGEDAPGIAKPTNLQAQGETSARIRLTWDYAAAGPTSFNVERTREGGSLPEKIFANQPGPQSFVDTTGLTEGSTYSYGVKAVQTGQTSAASDASLATTLPAAPANVVATPSDVDKIDVTWTNISSQATQIVIIDAVAGASVIETKIPVASAQPFSLNVNQGSAHVISAVAVVKGFQSGQPVTEIRSESSATVNVKPLALKATLDTNQANRQGRCLVQKIPKGLLKNQGTQVSLRVRGSSANSLTIDRIYLSQPAAAADPWDSLAPGPAGGLTKVLNKDQGDAPLFLPAGALKVLGPVSYAINPSADLIVAFDISPTAGQGNLIRGTLTNATAYQKSATQEAAIANRSTGYNTEQDVIYLIEAIEVI